MYNTAELECMPVVPSWHGPRHGQESRQDPWLPLRPPVFLKGPFTKGNGGSRLIGPESQVGGSRLWAKAWGPQS
eukprot:scaffold223335_cov16-Tisochrysis_lutea.AAC.2